MKLNEETKRFLLRELAYAVENCTPDNIIMDFPNDCLEFRFNVRMTEYAWRQLNPPKDPFVSIFEELALAIHEARKRRERD